MHKFAFRLQRVFDYREMVEGWARNAYLDAQAQRIEAEGGLDWIRKSRQELVNQPIGDIDDRLALEAALQRSDDDERAQLALIATLATEEERTLQAWFLSRQELQTLAKLKEKALAEWQYEADREEQKAMDELATMRRAA